MLLFAIYLLYPKSLTWFRAHGSNLFSLAASPKESTRADPRAKSIQLLLIYFIHGIFDQLRQKSIFLLCHPGNNRTLLIQTLLSEGRVHWKPLSHSRMRFGSLSCDCQLPITSCLSLSFSHFLCFVSFLSLRTREKLQDGPHNFESPDIYKYYQSCLWYFQTQK